MSISDNPRDYTWGKRKRNVYLWIGGGALLIIGLAVAGYFLFQSNTTVATNTNANINVPSSETRRALDGVKVAPEVANLYPWGIMVENLATTRPQSGFEKAGVVYEALAEGGITRFLLLMATEQDTGDIGPVRSARPYFVEWAREYDAMYVHVGGSSQGLENIKDLGVKDFNQFYNGGSFFYKEGKEPPHHMFTNSRLLTFGARDEGIPEIGQYPTWKFKDDAALSERPVEEKKITIDFSTFSYEVEYLYDRESNTYKRSQAGAAFTDAAADNKQVAPKNVVIQFVTITNYDVQRLNIQTVGSGKSIVFRDGQAIEGTWTKENATSRTRFYDGTGQEIELNAGQTWVEVIEKDRQNYSYN
ncbi:MAG: DUF3048 domain-containing protein [Patescibacteria group bacterium]|jgi:hypothetical protein